MDDVAQCGFTACRHTGYSFKMKAKQGHTPPNHVDTKSVWENCFGILLHSRTLSWSFYVQLDKTGFHDVSAILNSQLHWTPSLPPILNELWIANFPELLMSSLTVLWDCKVGEILNEVQVPWHHQSHRVSSAWVSVKWPSRTSTASRSVTLDTRRCKFIDNVRPKSHFEESTVIWVKVQDITEHLTKVK